jgi:predicted cation transporter
MLAIAVIALSTIIGVSGGPVWSAVVCGLVLATIALSERVPSLRRARAIGSSTVAVSVGASLMLAQIASIGTFAVGQLLGRLLLV